MIIGLPIRYRWVEANQVCSDLELWPKVKLNITSNPKLQRIGKFQKTLEGDRSSLKDTDGFCIIGKLKPIVIIDKTLLRNHCII